MQPSINSSCLWFITADRPLWQRKLHVKFKVWEQQVEYMAESKDNAREKKWESNREIMKLCRKKNTLYCDASYLLFLIAINKQHYTRQNKTAAFCFLFASVVLCLFLFLTLIIWDTWWRPWPTLSFHILLPFHYLCFSGFKVPVRKLAGSVRTCLLTVCT